MKHFTKMGEKKEKTFKQKLLKITNIFALLNKKLKSKMLLFYY